jgi:hypothetical protein
MSEFWLANCPMLATFAPVLGRNQFAEAEAFAGNVRLDSRYWRKCEAPIFGTLSG